MNYFRVQGALIAGIQAVPVQVECAHSRRLPFLQIIGGSGSAASELRERVIAALGTLRESKFRLPARRITVQFQPGVHGLPLEQLDLPVAIAILGSCEHFPRAASENLLICGGLGLDGTLRPAGNEAALRKVMSEGGFLSALLPEKGSEVLNEEQWRTGGGFRHLEEVVQFLRGHGHPKRNRIALTVDPLLEPPPPSLVWNRIEGQSVAKRMLEVAAAGGHHVLLPGPSAARPELLAHALSSLLPPMCERDAEEVKNIYALAGIEPELTPSRPFFAFGSCLGLPPLLQDRRNAKVEELLLAHRGVLYVDQICDREPILFPHLLDPMLRGRMQARIGRRRVELSAEPLVLASSPLCGCGGKGLERKSACTCRPTVARRFEERWRRLLRYPFDLCLKISAQREKMGSGGVSWEASCGNVAEARARIERRQGKWNSRLSEYEVFTIFPWKESVQKLWKVWELRASPDERDRFTCLARVALTLCDLRGGRQVEERDLLEAHHYFPAVGEEGAGRSASNSGADVENSTAIP